MSDVSDFLVKGKFTCTKCGSCCKNIAPIVAKGIFPKQWMNKSGGCKNQMKSGKCRIYERRPDYCRLSITLKGASDLEIATMCKTMNDYEETK